MFLRDLFENLMSWDNSDCSNFVSLANLNCITEIIDLGREVSVCCHTGLISIGSLDIVDVVVGIGFDDGS